MYPTLAPDDRPLRPLANRGPGAIFLCYHSVHPDGPPYLSVRPELFAAHLRTLRHHGYRSGRCADLVALEAGDPPEQPLAFITFDDGYVDNYEVALPILLEYGFSALVFLVTAQVGRPALVWPELSGAGVRYPDVMRPLSWEMVDAMAAAGVEFGSHTRTHPHLPRLDDAMLADELATSRAELEARVGTCLALAYPFGEWNARVASRANTVGYRWAFSLPPGVRFGGPWCIPRVSVDHRDDARRFALKLHPVVRALILSRTAHAARLARIRLRVARGG